MLKFYYDLASQPCRAMYVFLQRTGHQFEKCSLRISKGEHKTAEFTAINPLQTLPAIDDQGFKLGDSVAIFHYLMNKYPDLPRHWYGKSIQDQAKVDSYLHWHHLNTRLQCASYIQVAMFIPLMTGTKPDPEKVAKHEKRMNGTLNLIEKIWLKDTPYLTGDYLTFADLHAYCEIQQPRLTGYSPFEDRPKLKNWYETVEKELSPEIIEASKALAKIKKAIDMYLAKL